MDNQGSSEIIFLSQPEEVSMSDDWYEYNNEDHFWIQWRFAVLKRMISPYLKSDNDLMDIGCGNSIFRSQLESQLNRPVDGCELNSKALQMGRRCLGKSFIYNIFDHNPKITEKYDGLFLLDVIEHIENDKEFIINSLSLLRSSGFCVINVPLHSWLFSVYDSKAGHVRRYSRKLLIETVESCGLKILDCQAWGLSMIPVLWIRKFVLKLVPEERVIEKGFRPPSGILNLIFKTLMFIEVKLLGSVPTGTSLSLIAIKKD